MTNDLNNIPASVREALGSIKQWSFDTATEIPPKEFRKLQNAMYAANRLCQPNIVIVDLDDEKLVERVAEAIKPYVSAQYKANNAATAALAALKEK